MLTAPFGRVLLFYPFSKIHFERIFFMKKTIKTSISIILAIVCLLGLTACGNSVNKEGLWENATYLKDTTFGDGQTPITVEVKAGEQSVKFTVNTDKETVGAALLEHKLIDGEEGPYGLYIKKVNGITADYDTDKAYWAFYINDDYALKGIDQTTIEKDKTYRLEYAK